MDHLTKDKTRDIIDDFVKEVQEAKRTGSKPEYTVIDFREDRRNNIERRIYEVPTGLLRFRKDNGRIKSNILNYEKDNGILIEKSKSAQDVIREILEEKDKEKTEELKSDIISGGQREPVIITCDGFLINGNRRKMVLDMIANDSKYANNTQFQVVKIVILPGKDDEGGPPTLKEIEKIENRYQFMSDGRADYFEFDKAISMRDKIKLGFPLEEQLRDDPRYSLLGENEFKKALTKVNKDYLEPLECVDMFLSSLGRNGLYETIATGLGDPLGRWQAFVDYSQKVHSVLKDERKRGRFGIKENEIGKIQDCAYKLIRQRKLPDLPKANDIMRNIPKWLTNNDSKKELLQLVKIDQEVPDDDCKNEDGNYLNPREIDIIWSAKNATKIIKHVKNAIRYHDHKKELETPVTLLEDALKKLYHGCMDTSTIRIDDIKKAMKLTKDIQSRANEIEKELYHHEKKCKKLKNKGKSN